MPYVVSEMASDSSNMAEPALIESTPSSMPTDRSELVEKHDPHGSLTERSLLNTPEVGGDPTPNARKLH